MGTDRIACVMPVRDGARTVRRAVVSTLAALPEDGVLYVRDDGSQDGTLAVLRAVRDRRLVVFAGDRVGVAGSLNEMLGHVSAPVVARMDADDVCVRWRFRRQMSLLGGAEFVFSPWVAWRSGTPMVKVNGVGRLSPEASRYLLLIENPFAHPTALMRRRSLIALGGYRDAPSEDYDLWLRAANRSFRIVRAGPPTVVYRHHRQQLTKREQWRQQRHADPRVRGAWAELATTMLGFVPSWFDWRRDGFPPSGATDEIRTDLHRMRRTVLMEPSIGQRGVLRRIDWMLQKAHQAT